MKTKVVIVFFIFFLGALLPILFTIIEEAEETRHNVKIIEGYAKYVEYVYAACLFENPIGTDCTKFDDPDIIIIDDAGPGPVTCGTRIFSTTSTGAKSTVTLANCSINDGPAIYGYSNGAVTTN